MNTPARSCTCETHRCINNGCLCHSVLPTLCPHHIPTNFSIATSSLDFFPVFLCLGISCPSVFLNWTLHPHTPQSPSIWLCLFHSSLFSSLCSAYKSFPFWQLYIPCPRFPWAMHPLQAALSPLVWKTVHEDYVAQKQDPCNASVAR